MVTSAKISPSCRTNDAECIFSYKYLSQTVKSNSSVKRIGESAGWAHPICLVVKTNGMSARMPPIIILIIYWVSRSR